MKRRIVWLCAISLLLFALAPEAVRAQFSYRRTVGDETENQFQPGAFRAIKYRGAIISSPTRTRGSSSVGEFLTRHSRLGNSTGIGGSTLQTTSVTSESRPALAKPSSISLGSPLIDRPNLKVNFESATQSPALKSFEVHGPGSEETEFGRRPETFTTSAPLSGVSGSSLFSSQTEEFKFGE